MCFPMTIGDPCKRLVRTPYKEVATHSLRTAGLDAKVQHTQAANSETIKKKTTCIFRTGKELLLMELMSPQLPPPFPCPAITKAI